MKYLKDIIFVLLLAVSAALILASIKGLPGNNGQLLRFQTNADYLTDRTYPFEATNSNSRYAIIESFVERNNFFFTDEQARFSVPDIVYYHNRFFSIFTPGISFLALPFYLIGKYVGLPQFITFSFNILALFFNIFLIIRLAQAFGANKYASLLGSLLYVFATNSLAYALTLNQHQFSATLVLLALLNIRSSHRTILKNVVLGLIFSLGILVDIPNLFLLLPMIIYASICHFSAVSNKVKVNLNILFLGLATVPLLLVFGWYNHQLTGSYFKLGQVLGRSEYPPKIEEKKDSAQINQYGYIKPNLPLETRLQLNGLYQLLVSPERGWFFYSPVVILGLIGLYLGLKNTQTKNLSIVAIGSIAATIVVYSMHGDPWGGWAFGPRYLIPASAVVGAGFSLAFSKFKTHWLFLVTFICLTIYSVIISVSGALTTTLIPPQVEAVRLDTPLPYTYQLNFDYIFSKSSTGSLIYHAFLNNWLDVKSFYIAYSLVTIALIFSTYLLALTINNRNS